MWPGCAAWLEPAAAEHGPRCLAAFAARWRKSEGRAGTRGSGAAARAAANAAAGSARRAPHSRLPHLATRPGAQRAAAAAARGCESFHRLPAPHGDGAGRAARAPRLQQRVVAELGEVRAQAELVADQEALAAEPEQVRKCDACAPHAPRPGSLTPGSDPGVTYRNPNLMRRGPAALRPGQTRGARQPVKVTRLR